MAAGCPPEKEPDEEPWEAEVQVDGDDRRHGDIRHHTLVNKSVISPLIRNLLRFADIAQASCSARASDYLTTCFKCFLLHHGKNNARCKRPNPACSHCIGAHRFRMCHCTGLASLSRAEQRHVDDATAFGRCSRTISRKPETSLGRTILAPILMILASMAYWAPSQRSSRPACTQGTCTGTSSKVTKTIHRPSQMTTYQSSRTARE